MTFTKPLSTFFGVMICGAFFGPCLSAQTPVSTSPGDHDHDFPQPYDSEPEKTSPMSAEQAAATAVLPPGFRCEVFASEPDVQQPIAMCFDGRGRLWVAECYTYAERPDRWVDDLRDRIIILEDTDGDGRADKRDVFWDQANRLTSLAHVDGGVYALCPPQLLFIADADGDDVPDGEPEVVLDGFEVDTSSHNVANGLKVGPDGWLYGRHGILSVSLVGKPGTPDGRRTSVNTAIWRYHIKRQTFEVFCHGGTNPWGLDWNADGQLFYTNTVIGHLWHAFPGAYYERMFGASVNPHAYEVISQTADHFHWDTGKEDWNTIREGLSSSTSALGGGHAHMGCLIYKSGVWPDEYAGNLFTCNLHGRRINRDILEREGCGYVAHHGEDFLLMKDPFFRGLDVIAGPDGQLWINDWSDTGECHDNTGLHRRSGRIYRVVYEGDAKGAAKPQHADWLTARAQSDFGSDQINALLESDEEARRAMGVRFLCEDFGAQATTVDRLVHLARTEASGLVRGEVAAGLQRLPIDRRIEVAAALCERNEDADDRQQPLMIWYGVEEAVVEHADDAVKLAIQTRIPRIRSLIARRLGESLDEQPAAVERVLAASLASQSADIRPEVLQGLGQGLRGRARAAAPPNWDAVAAAVQRDGSAVEKQLVQELSLVFGDGRARDAVVTLAFDTEADPANRRAAVNSLMRQPSDDLLPKLIAAINDHVIAGEVVRALAHYEAPGVSIRLINRWRRSVVDRSAAIDSLVARKQHAFDLLAAIEAGKIPADAISPYQARQIENHGDAKLSERLRQVWGNIRETPEAKKQEMARWKSLLTADRIGAADPVAGKAIYLQQCASCHQLYGDGQPIGPNLTGSDRHNLDYLLGNVFDPSAVVPAAYRMSVFLLQDGRVLTGVVTAENDNVITLQTQKQIEQVDKGLIAQRKLSQLSLMPDGILTYLSETDVTNLVAYLMTQGPVASE
ncbi:c-type cytochrome [Stieleria sp. ICT_E10.1]|uniref:PVC-type heme-binding CxxCH protein n=1 Tax=Stieleria sedimenti TaxID=2976331 RepID=UPI00217F9813|nr:PVC-type heme-binding CxxCH protein [Stieleria sedimenti]MCS7471061.1 c-type cytochrome [Stieleria sedimenti]